MMSVKWIGIQMSNTIQTPENNPGDLIDEDDVRRLVARLLYVISAETRRKKLPSLLDLRVKKFISGKTTMTIGDREYTYKELLDFAMKRGKIDD